MANTWVLWVDAILRWCSQHAPQLTLQWQNRRLFASAVSRVLRASVLCAAMIIVLNLIWRLSESLLKIQSPTAQWQQHQEKTQHFSAQLKLKQKQFVEAQERIEAHHKLLVQQQIKFDELTLTWPNSNFRLLMLSRLQTMARQQGLQVLDIKTAVDKSQHGFEASTLRFSVRGAESATHGYWQALDQLFQNGLWLSWVFRVMPDGLWTLEGQLHLLWNPEDADTDTGVQMLDMAADSAHEGATKYAARPVLESLPHLLPDQSQQSLHVVGSARPSSLSEQNTAWTWIRSGQQIHLVQSGQRLGIEKQMAMHADEHGLWLLGETGQAATPLSWEAIKP